MQIMSRGWVAASRWGILALLALLGLGACGGGGGGSETPSPTLTGDWQVSLVESGTTYTGGTVPASTIPTQEQVASLSADSFAEVFATTVYEGYTVSINGATLTITGPGTNLTIVINSVSGSNYQSCGTACGIGAVVSYDVTVNLTANGTADNQPVTGTDSGTVTVRYTRVS